MVDAILSALSTPALEGCLDLAGPESLPRRELVARAAALLDRQPSIVPLPLPLVKLVAFASEFVLSSPPFTRPMLDVLEHDDAVDPEPACARLGIRLTPLETTLRRTILEDPPA